jgi:hypothetical protein
MPVDHRQVLDLLRPQWEGGYWAKSSGELLWAHHYTLWSVGSKLIRHMPSVDARERHLFEIACLTHDLGKRREKCQQRMRAGQGPGDHKLELDELTRYFREELRDGEVLSDQEIQCVWDIARTHHSVSGKDISAQSFARAGVLGKTLMTADWLASMDDPDSATLSRLREFYEGRLAFTSCQLSRFPAPSTYLAVRIALRSYREARWEPLVVFPQGAIFLADPGQKPPVRSELARAIEAELIQQSLALQKGAPTGYTGDFLTLLSRQYPHLFLNSRREKLTEQLGTVDRALVFQKLARDILNARGLMGTAARKDCPPLLDLLNSANSTSAHPNAKERYEELYGRPPPEKVNRDMLDPLFEESRIQDIIPGSVPLPPGLTPSRRLRELTGPQLFAILEATARPPDTQAGAADAGSDLQHYLQTCLSMEEEMDFAAAARQIFDRYKAYKQTADADKGVCERCACPVSGKMQPGLNFATAPQAFSQIKAKYQYRAICPLCGYDNLIVRQGTSDKTTRIYARIETRIPDLLRHFPSLQRLLGALASGVRRPRQIVRFGKWEGGGADLPLPRRLFIPLSDPEAQQEEATEIPLNERGVLIRLADTSLSRGPKDLRGEYEPVYHILRFLGFMVDLGPEEQDGLFGDLVPTTETTYLRSLAVILLASVVDKKANRYVYSSELLERSPAVALTLAAGDGRDRFGLKKDFLRPFLAYLVQADVPVTTREGDVFMHHLLEDAAILAPSLVAAEQDNDADEPGGLEGEPDEAIPQRLKRRGGLWSFCEHKAGEKLTKHSATKPISQALDELMLGRGVEMALNKFLQHLSVKVKAEHAEERRRFVANVRKILERADSIRQKNITDFLRYKNGLLSAVYMFTRYPDLKEVTTNREANPHA